MQRISHPFNWLRKKSSANKSKKVTAKAISLCLMFFVPKNFIRKYIFIRHSIIVAAISIFFYPFIFFNVSIWRGNDETLLLPRLPFFLTAAALSCRQERHIYNLSHKCIGNSPNSSYLSERTPFPLTLFRMCANHRKKSKPRLPWYGYLFRGYKFRYRQFHLYFFLCIPL